MDSSERRALLLLVGLAVAGHGVRMLVNRPGQAPGAVELLPADPGRSPAAHKDSIMALARPLEPGERIDLDRAGAQEIARLPRVGLALAKRIVADRESGGPFGSLGGFDRVPGVGAGLLREVEPHVTFSGMARASVGATAPAEPKLLSLNSATATELDHLPGIGPTRAAAIVQERERGGPYSSVDDLTRVPGVTPSMVRKLRNRVRVP
jgi:competence ComEA-like helix-hairpin-helix protein